MLRLVCFGTLMLAGTLTVAQADAAHLLEAAEAAYQAVQENAEFNHGKATYPADLMGTPVQPECLAPFTKWEIEHVG